MKRTEVHNRLGNIKLSVFDFLVDYFDKDICYTLLQVLKDARQQVKIQNRNNTEKPDENS